MKTEVKPTIAWLWDRFQKLGDYIETEKVLQSWGTKGSDGLSHDGRNHSFDEVELQSLRQQLLERCEKVKDTFGNYDTFSAGHDAEGRPLIDVEHRGHDREDSPATAREMGCAYLFWAWELEQMEKEASGD